MRYARLLIPALVLVFATSASAQSNDKDFDEDFDEEEIHDRHDHEQPNWPLEKIQAALASDDEDRQSEALISIEALGADDQAKLMPQLLAIARSAVDSEPLHVVAHLLGRLGAEEAVETLVAVARALIAAEHDVEEAIYEDDYLDSGVTLSHVIGSLLERPERGRVAAAALELVSESSPPLRQIGLYLAFKLPLTAWDSPQARAEAWLPLAKALAFDSEQEELTRELGFAVLSVLGEQARPVLPELILLLRDEEVDETVGEVLKVLGDHARPAVEASLAHEDLVIRRACVHVLRELGPPISEEALASLLEMVAPDSELRGAAVWALWILGQGPRALSRTVPLLSDPDDRTRRMAAELVGDSAEGDEQAVAALIDALEAERDDYVRARLLMALGKQGPAAAPAVDVLLNAVSTGDEPTQRLALTALGRIGPAASRVAPQLGELLKASRFHYWHPAWTTLAKLGPAGLPYLLPALDNPSRALRQRAAEVIGEGGVTLAGAIPQLEECLERELYFEVRQVLGHTLALLRGQEPPELDWEEVEGPFSPEGVGPDAVTFPVRPRRAKIFRLRWLTRSPLTEPLIRDWDALEARLAELKEDSGGKPVPSHSVLEAWFDLLDPSLPVFDSEQIERLIGQRLTQGPLALVEEHLGEELFLGDVVTTDDYRGLSALIVGERLSAEGKPERCLIAPYRMEYYVTPPSYLSFPSVVPYGYWSLDDHQVDCFPVERDWVLENLEGTTLMLGRRRFELTDEEVQAISDPEDERVLYLGVQEDWTFLHPRAEVDRSLSRVLARSSGPNKR